MLLGLLDGMSAQRKNDFLDLQCVVDMMRVALKRWNTGLKSEWDVRSCDFMLGFRIESTEY